VTLRPHIASALLVTACASTDEVELPPLVFESEHAILGVHADLGGMLCRADLAYVDAQIERVEAQLGVRRETTVAVRLVPFTIIDEVCGADSGACYDPSEDVIYSRWHSLGHELVHAVARDLEFPSLFWSEGAAEALSGSTLTLGKLSGRAGFDERLRMLGIHVEPEVLDTLYAEAISLADQKKQVTDADLLALAEQHADPVPQLVQIEHWASASRQGESSSGNVSLFYEGRTFRAFAGGNGPVDALLSAVDNALEQIIDGRPQLVDYQLKSIGQGEDAQGEATVKIAAPATDGEAPQIFTGHGLSTNVVEASLRAYLAAVNKLIAEHPVAADAMEAARARQRSSRQPAGAGTAT